MDNPEVISETRKMIDEILELEDALERLAGAHIVVDSLTARLNLAEKVIVTLKNTIMDRDATLSRIQIAMIDMAQDLARAGSYDHRGKNEAILGVIARLLAHGNGRDSFTVFDDVPF